MGKQSNVGKMGSVGEYSAVTFFRHASPTSEAGKPRLPDWLFFKTLLSGRFKASCLMRGGKKNKHCGDTLDFFSSLYVKNDLDSSVLYDRRFVNL